jgi:serine protease Do
LTLDVNVKPLPTDLTTRAPGGQPAAERNEETFYTKNYGLEVRDKSSVAEDAYAEFTGVLVDRVDEDGLAAEAGIGPGMLIMKVGRIPIESITEFAAAVEEQSPEEGIVLQIRTPSGNRLVLLKKD